MTRKSSSSHYVVKKNSAFLSKSPPGAKIKKTGKNRIFSLSNMSTKKYDADPWSKMSAEESGAVDELMKRVAGLQIPKMDLDPKLSVLRFLRARNGNVDKAEKMLRHTIEFRDKTADKILDEFDLPEVLKKYMPKKLNWDLKGANFDKLGRLIALESLGQIDPKGIVNGTSAAGPNFMGLYNSFSFELTLARMKELSKQRGVPTCQVVLIEDLKGLGTQHLYPAGLKMFGKIVRVMEDHYPEVLGTAGMCSCVRSSNIATQNTKQTHSRRERPLDLCHDMEDRLEIFRRENEKQDSYSQFGLHAHSVETHGQGFDSERARR